MNREEVLSILNAIKTDRNAYRVEDIIKQVTEMDDEKLQDAINSVGGTKESVKSYLEEKVSEGALEQTEEHIPVNDMFAYGVNGDCVHLHLPVDLHEMLALKGRQTTLDTVNLYLLDAIDKLKFKRESREPILRDVTKIYMLSPILTLKKELDFLKELGFDTRIYNKKDLASEEFVESNSEARLAIGIFGQNQSVGRAIAPFDIVYSKTWKDKNEECTEELARKGITIDKDSSSGTQCLVDELQGLVETDIPDAGSGIDMDSTSIEPDKPDRF